MNTVAILLLAGKSTRFDSETSKQVFSLGGKPVFTYPLLALNNSNLIQEICVVTDEKNLKEISSFVNDNNISKAKVILGGETRQESVENGLKFFESKSGEDLVLIHDGARPLLNEEIIERVIESTKMYGAVTTYIPMEDTAAVSDQGNSIMEFIDRSKLVRIQTPQAFKLDLIREAHKYAGDKYATDDCSLVMALPHQVKLILGSKKLTKLTTLEDLNYLETFIK